MMETDDVLREMHLTVKYRISRIIRRRLMCAERVRWTGPISWTLP